MRTTTFELQFKHQGQLFLLEYQMDYDSWEFYANILRIESQTPNAFVNADVLRAATEIAQEHAEQEWAEFRESQIYTQERDWEE